MMKVQELIEQLQKMPLDREVCIFDWKDNLNNDPGDGEGNGVGIYPEFKVYKFPNGSLAKGSKKFIALEFTNPNTELTA